MSEALVEIRARDEEIQRLKARVAELEGRLERIALVTRSDADPNARVKAWEIAVGQEPTPSVYTPAHTNALGQPTSCENAERHIARLSDHLGEANDELQRLKSMHVCDECVGEPVHYKCPRPETAALAPASVSTALEPSVDEGALIRDFWLDWFGWEPMEGDADAIEPVRKLIRRIRRRPSPTGAPARTPELSAPTPTPHLSKGARVRNLRGGQAATVTRIVVDVQVDGLERNQVFRWDAESIEVLPTGSTDR